MTEARPKMAPIKPVKAGLLAGGTEKAMMVYDPEAIPAPPAPAIARPTMRVVLLLATAQMRDPTSKMKMLIRKLNLRGKYLYALPHVDWKAPSVKKKAEPYQPTWSTDLNWSVILGIAVATMVMSDRLVKDWHADGEQFT